MKTQEILKEIYDSTAPGTMSKEQAIGFMNDIIGDLEVMVESLEQEIEDEES